jgi:hypothetical protein
MNETDNMIDFSTFPDDDTGLARNTDPETSHLAAQLVDVPGLMREIYEVMLPFGEKGCIGDDVIELLPERTAQTLSPRYTQMVAKGMIEVTGEKRKGKICNRLQMVRRVLPPPFVKPFKLSTTKCCPHCGEEL